MKSALLLWAIMMPTLVNAQLTYSAVGGKATITGYTGNLPSSLLIPSTTNGNTVVSIANNAFNNKSGYFSVTIPSSVTNIGSQAFGGCYGLLSATLGGGLVTIGNNAFQNCNQLGSVAIPGSVVNFGIAAFSGCANLTSVMFSNGLANIGNSAFNGCYSLTSIIIPSSVTNIGGSAFGFCSGLKTLIISNGVANLGANAFTYCTGLTNTLIPGSVTSIGASAFAFCSSLASVTISNGVANIGDEAFAGIKLTNFTIPSSVTNIGVGVFQQCSNLTAITVDPANTNYSSANGVLFDKNQTTLLTYPGGLIGKYTISNSVTTITSYAFSFCPNLTSVTIPGATTNLGDYAFYSCPALGEIYFQGNAPTVGSYTFYGDNNTTAYYLPDTIGWSDFALNSGLLIVPWLPEFQTTDGSFGVKSNGFGFTYNWANGQTVVVEACTNLSNPIWQALQTNTLTGGTVYFYDPKWTNYSVRYYQLRSQ